MIENSMFARNKQGKQALVFAMQYPVTSAVELAARTGFHAIHLDGEHGAFRRRRDRCESAVIAVMNPVAASRPSDAGRAA